MRCNGAASSLRKHAFLVKGSRPMSLRVSPRWLGAKGQRRHLAEEPKSHNMYFSGQLFDYIHTCSFQTHAGCRSDGGTFSEDSPVRAEPSPTLRPRQTSSQPKNARFPGSAVLENGVKVLFLDKEFDPKSSVDNVLQGLLPFSEQALHQGSNIIAVW
jgi:hypothetical protein